MPSTALLEQWLAIFSAARTLTPEALTTMQQVAQDVLTTQQYADLLTVWAEYAKKPPPPLGRKR